jgi:hypothetical protein
VRAVGLFSEPFDIPAVEIALAEDDFFSVAFIVLGIKANWKKALDQTARLISIFEDRDLNWRLVYRMVALLIRRAETFDDTSACLNEIVEAIGVLPGSNFLEEIKMAHLHKLDPQAWQREKNRIWVENYRTQMSALRQGEERE